MNRSEAWVLHDIFLRRAVAATGIPLERIPLATRQGLFKVLLATETPGPLGSQRNRAYVTPPKNPLSGLLEEQERSFYAYTGPVFITGNAKDWKSAIHVPFDIGHRGIVSPDRAITAMMERVSEVSLGDYIAIAKGIPVSPEKYGSPFALLAAVEAIEVRGRKALKTTNPLWIIPDVTREEMAYLRRWENDNKTEIVE